ncbi:uncharacterized protein METZ01_LOCUS65015, partial [marine metagenome]
PVSASTRCTSLSRVLASSRTVVARSCGLLS